jgi:hypothetical protein
MIHGLLERAALLLSLPRQLFRRLGIITGMELQVTCILLSAYNDPKWI